MDYKLLRHAQIYIEKMANGIDPLTEKNIKEDDLLNNIRISRCLFYVNDILKEVILNLFISLNIIALKIIILINIYINHKKRTQQNTMSLLNHITTKHL